MILLQYRQWHFSGKHDTKLSLVKAHMTLNKQKSKV